MTAAPGGGPFGHLLDVDDDCASLVCDHDHTLFTFLITKGGRKTPYLAVCLALGLFLLCSGIVLLDLC